MPLDDFFNHNKTPLIIFKKFPFKFTIHCCVLKVKKQNSSEEVEIKMLIE